MKNLTALAMKKALARLDELIDEQLSRKVTLIMGGGGAMILAHSFPLSTTDIDAIPAAGTDFKDLDPLVKQIAREQDLSSDWINPYFVTYSYTLPSDYSERLIEVFAGRSLSVKALGLDDMLLMKCFAHRQKDVGHAKALIKAGANIARVEKQIEYLVGRGISGADLALEFLDEVMDL
jgi:hypothetical protein